ncbi:hypothetical protein BN77_0923 [Rhizobium mesoamericanum STM3625]|uniref:Uncharacterized protein n=1 Tax=Rhizobium mesoamericanum STM3625 TaxID=1211777 RepID=K0Q125_9HYPH|nr:hypothetical protein BN77_0923 [Rhizobium mesoamericanum STM3625]
MINFCVTRHRCCVFLLIWPCRILPDTPRAHAGLNCIWIGCVTPVQSAAKSPAGIIGGQGARYSAASERSLVTAILDPRRHSAAEARPWQRKAREGEIYREKMAAVKKQKLLLTRNAALPRRAFISRCQSPI